MTDTSTTTPETETITTYDRTLETLNHETGEYVSCELHEFFGTDEDSYNVDLMGAEDGSGRPGISVAAHAIQFLVGQRDDDPSVGEIADAFRMPAEAVVQAVEWHPWMVLAGDRSGDIRALTVCLDGE